jgi:hypothetical protein
MLSAVCIAAPITRGSSGVCISISRSQKDKNLTLPKDSESHSESTILECNVDAAKGVTPCTHSPGLRSENTDNSFTPDSYRRGEA